MRREVSIGTLQADKIEWDIVVIGGGATGLGIAVDAATRGYRTVLVEARDFAQGASSRSTKLIHGGVRYLRAGEFGLVRRALRERGRLRQNGAGIVRDLGFVIPTYSRHERWYFGAGLKLYDLLGGAAIGPSRMLGVRETLELVPNVHAQGLRGGVLYYDTQFDDARLALHLALVASAGGAVLANYARVTSLLQKGGRVTGVIVRDEETGREFSVGGRIVINATGVFVDQLRRLEEPDTRAILAPSQGAHVIVPSYFLQGNHAVLIPQTSDGRVLFAIPWRGRTLIGTTDTQAAKLDAEPRPLAEEVSYLLEHASQALSPAPALGHILSMFAGQRPLARSRYELPSRFLSRDRLIEVSRTGMMTVAGGKWTTYRETAEAAVTSAARLVGLPARRCRTADLSLIDIPGPPPPFNPRRFHHALPITIADVQQAARTEMARTVEDVLARRTRTLLLDARYAVDIAPAVARCLGDELGWTEDQRRRQYEDFRTLARRYLPGELSQPPPTCLA